MLAEVRSRIAAACARVGRGPAEVKLVAVTKGRSLDQIERLLIAKGCRVLGENRVQEWREKSEQLSGAGIEWHMIGNLQRNKVKYCRPFHTIHSLNSKSLADELQRQGERLEHRFRVLVEVNLAAEESKRGVDPGGADELAEYASRLPNLELTGLMTMAPWYDDAERTRPVFAGLRELRDKLGLVDLSMGMSNDFEVAVEEGATLVRVGAALFQGGSA
jgi:pyridoxal phosphate enzyme (YggS family)